MAKARSASNTDSEAELWQMAGRPRGRWCQGACSSARVLAAAGDH